MALINCPECNKEVSDKAEVCIHCGYGIKAHFSEITEIETNKKNHQNEMEQAKKDLERKLNSIVIPQSKPKINGMLIAGIISFVLFVLLIYASLFGEDTTSSVPAIYIIISGLISFFLCVGGFGKLKEDRKMFQKYANDQNEYRRQLLIEKENLEEQVNKIRKASNKTSKIETNDKGEVCCPKCGSNQIQLLNRKWTATTGFINNKVDRVCVKCKHRF